MPRNKRIDIPGAIHHVIVRGIERRRIFIDDKDRVNFIKRLKKSLLDTSCQCYAWVLMPNHVHLLIKTGKRSLTDMMRSLLTGYAIYFNHRHHRHGYLYQNRYKSILCQEDAYLQKLVSYIHLNPLRARIVQDLNELDDYSWSGHMALIGKKYNDWQATKEALSHFGNTIKEARCYYKKFMIENVEKMRTFDLSGGGLKRSAGGWRKIEILKKDKIFWRGDERILGDGEFVDRVLKEADERMDENERIERAGWDIEKLTLYICSLLSIEQGDLSRKGRGNTRSLAKGLLCYWGYAKLGLSGAQLARYLNVSRPAISKNVALGEKLAGERGLKLIS